MFNLPCCRFEVNSYLYCETVAKKKKRVLKERGVEQDGNSFQFFDFYHFPSMYTQFFGRKFRQRKMSAGEFFSMISKQTRNAHLAKKNTAVL